MIQAKTKLEIVIEMRETLDRIYEDTRNFIPRMEALKAECIKENIDYNLVRMSEEVFQIYVEKNLIK